LPEAIGIFRGLGTSQNAELARALDALGIGALMAGRYKEAETTLGEAVRVAIAASGEGHPETAVYQSDLALAYIQDRQYDRAEPLLKRARFVTEAQPYPDQSRLGAIFTELSLAACGQNRFASAEEAAREAIAIFDHSPEANSSAAVLARVNLAVVYLREHRTDEAERILPAAVLRERQMAPNSCLLADGIRELAELRTLQHSWHEAAALYQESIGIYETRLGAGNPTLAPILKAYAEALKHDGTSKAQAKAIAARAKAILRG
jgi:Tfp pilus assembly protein PilF